MNKIITQGVKYAGSKRKLIPHILSLIDKKSIHEVFDGFSGTTRVSQALARSGYRVVCNDIAQWSYVFATCYLRNRQSADYYQELIDHLNNIPSFDGWFTEHYGGFDYNGSAQQKDGTKKPWQMTNTRKLDGIREEIDLLNLPEIEKSVALTSLMLALDSVDNTLGHFTSYLNRWSARSYKPMQLKVPKLFINEEPHQILKGDIFSHLDDIEVDLAYFDPPYGSNNEKMPPSRVRYAGYYHLWDTICKNDKPALFGAVGRRNDSRDRLSVTVFEDYRQDGDGRFLAVKAIDQLIARTKARYIALSYSSGGKATARELYEILNHHGKLLQTLEINYQKNVMSYMVSSQLWLRESETPHREFIFLIEK